MTDEGQVNGQQRREGGGVRDLTAGEVWEEDEDVQQGLAEDPEPGQPQTAGPQQDDELLLLQDETQ